MSEVYPWYRIVKGHEALLQGDFIDGCPIVVSPSNISDEPEVAIKEYDTVVMSQSCDLEQGKLDLVLVCPVWLLSEFEKEHDYYKTARGKESLRRGHLPGYHLLNKCELDAHKKGYLVVDFRNVYSVPFDFLTNLAKQRDKRLRLLPPYREHLSQAFARFFMRVGLPVDIPPFK